MVMVCIVLEMLEVLFSILVTNWQFEWHDIVTAVWPAQALQYAQLVSDFEQRGVLISKEFLELQETYSTFLEEKCFT